MNFQHQIKFFLPTISFNIFYIKRLLTLALVKLYMTGICLFYYKTTTTTYVLSFSHFLLVFPVELKLGMIFLNFSIDDMLLVGEGE